MRFIKKKEAQMKCLTWQLHVFLLSHCCSITDLFSSFVFPSTCFACCLLLSSCPLLSAFPSGLLSARCPADELYAQKLKYKAISEELDHALNDMTSL